jgi:hypothetical protein
MSVVYLRVRSSGRVHMGNQMGSQTFTDERCNLDDAGDRLSISLEEFQATLPALRCKRCFPDPVAADPQPDSDAARDGADVPNPDAADDAGEERY